jgi:hypothetical protein
MLIEAWGFFVGSEAVVELCELVGLVVVVELQRTGPTLPSIKVVEEVDEADLVGVDDLVVLAINWLWVCQKCSSTFEHSGVGTPLALVDRVIVASGMVIQSSKPRTVCAITQVRESEV